MVPFRNKTEHVNVYRPRTKDERRLCFDTSLCVRPHLQGGTTSIRRGGVPYPRSRWGVPHPADGGYLIPGLDRRVSHPRSGQGGYPIPGLDRGYPIPGPGGGYPIQLMGYSIPDLDRGTPSQVQVGGTLGFPPCPGLDGVPPPKMGYPPGPGMGYSHPGLSGISPTWTWDGVPPI